MYFIDKYYYKFLNNFSATVESEVKIKHEFYQTIHTIILLRSHYTRDSVDNGWKMETLGEWMVEK
jgi:hypothetical protein